MTKRLFNDKARLRGRQPAIAKQTGGIAEQARRDGKIEDGGRALSARSLMKPAR